MSYLNLKPSRMHAGKRVSRAGLVDKIFQRHFAGWNPENEKALFVEALARSLCPGPFFEQEFNSFVDDALEGFGPQLVAPSADVVDAFRIYARTDLGEIGLQMLLEQDERHILKGWRLTDGTLTESGIKAYGEGKWCPFRVASGGGEMDTVTRSGVLLLPDQFPHAEAYRTGDLMNPVAMLHHEIMAHVLPQQDSVSPGCEAEMLCIQYESDMLVELGLPVRTLNWGRERGTLDRTLHVQTRRYYHGLVQFDANGELIEVDPDTLETIGKARICN